MGYDGQSYRSQLIGNSKKKRFPVLTLVLYFGTKHWTGPRTLHEALELPEHLKPYVSDYKIQVFEIAFLEEEQVELFQSDFKYVADYFVQMRKKKDYTPSKETMEHVDAVLKIMSVLTNDSRFEEAQNDGTEVRSMCEVLDRVERRGIEQGIQQGKREGIKEGIRQGKMEGMQQGIKEGIHILVESLREFGQTDEQILSKIMEKYGLLKEEAEKYIC